MADELNKPVPDAAPTAAATAAPENSPVSPSSTEPAAAPAVAPVTAPAPADPVNPVEPAPVSTPTPGAENTPAAEPAKTENILGDEPPKKADEKAPETKPGEKPAEKAPETKPADGEKPVEGETKKDEGGQSAEPAPLPTYEEFKLPEGVSLQPELVGEFAKKLGAFENGPKDHAATQAFGQELVDYHIAQVQQGIERVHDAYKTGWEKQTNDWLQEFKNDPEIGGNRQQTTVDAAQKFITTHGGNEAEQAEFRKLMKDTGIGNHKVMIRLLAKASQNMAEGRMNPAQQPLKAPKTKTQTLYGKSS